MPSGPKKRKAAKRKMKSVGVTVQGNGGSESGSEINSPMSADVAQFDGERGEGGAVGELETRGTVGDVVKEENGGEKVVVEQKKPVIHEKSEVNEDKVKEVELDLSHNEPSASDSTGLLPISQEEVVNVEHVAPEKEVVLQDPEDKEKLEKPVLVIVEQSAPISSEDKGVEEQVDIHVEKVEPLAPERPPIDKKEEVVENLGSEKRPVDEAEEKEEKVDVVDSQPLSYHEKEDESGENSVKAPASEKRKDIEASFSVEPPATLVEEENVLRLSDNKSHEQPADKVPQPSQAVPKTSWLNCCGLFDAFFGSN